MGLKCGGDVIYVVVHHADMEAHQLAVLAQPLNGTGDGLYRTPSAAVGVNPAYFALQVFFVAGEPGKIAPL